MVCSRHKAHTMRHHEYKQQTHSSLSQPLKHKQVWKKGTTVQPCPAHLKQWWRASQLRNTPWSRDSGQRLLYRPVSASYIQLERVDDCSQHPLLHPHHSFGSLSLIIICFCISCCDSRRRCLQANVRPRQSGAVSPNCRWTCMLLNLPSATARRVTYHRLSGHRGEGVVNTSAN